MQLSPILSPDGRPMFSAGGEQSYKTAEHRGFVVSLEWVGNGRKAYAAMVIWPATNILVRGEGAGMWAISRNCMTDFVGFDAAGKCTGTASADCFREAQQALAIMGKDINDKQALNALMDCVITYAPDLIHMPAVPLSVRKQLDTPAMWEVTATDKSTGKVTHEGEI